MGFCGSRETGGCIIIIRKLILTPGMAARNLDGRLEFWLFGEGRPQELERTISAYSAWHGGSHQGYVERA